MHPGTLPSESASAGATAAARAAAVWSVAVGCLVLAGWLFDIDRLKEISPRSASMKANPAVCFVLAGMALWWGTGARRTPGRRLAVRLSAAIPLAIGGLTLSQHLFGWDLGIDQLLFAEPAGERFTTSPGRMGPPASLCFALVGAALLLLDRAPRRGGAPAQWLALAVLLVAFLPALGYLYGAEGLYGIARLTGIAVHTSLSLMVLALGILLARPGFPPVRILFADDAGGLLARRLLPAAVLLPVLFGWLRRGGEAARLYDTRFGDALLVLLLVVTLAALVWATAARLGRLAAERRRLEEQRQELLDSERAARQEAERAGQLKDEFLATLSHELRTPLNAILGWVTLLRSGRSGAAETDKGLLVIERNTRVQAQLVEDLLDVSRIISGKLRLEVHPVDLPQVVEAAVQATLPAAGAKDIRIQKAVDSGAGPVHGDPARLQQVLWNLLANAVKFTPRGGRVEVRLARAASYVEVTVADTGPGIRPEFLPHVFDRFRQADGTTTRRFGGLGLGLSIVRHLVEAHGGTAGVSSPGEGQGATFTVRLPLAAHPPADGGAPPRPGLPAAPAPPAPAPCDAQLDGVRVLVVEDEPDSRQLIERVLAECGAEVTAATGVDEALRLLDQRHPDVLVSDIGMPGRDGYDLVREIRSRGLGAEELPAVALTAFARPEDRRRALSAGFQVHLTKPVDPNALIALVARLAGRGGPAENAGPRTAEP